MSWGIDIIGKPELIPAKLDEYAESLNSPAKEEFNDAKPYLKGLVEQNVNPPDGLAALLHLTASGHAIFRDGKKIYGTTSVKLDPLYVNLVV